MSKKITSIKHKGDKRAHIPSQEEAGMESANEQVKQKDQTQYSVNPVVHRGQDPELFWLNKYGNDDREDLLKIDIRSLYRHEHISPELLINNLYKIKGGQQSQLDMFSLFGNTIKMDELEKVADYYKYSDDWKNRLIQGDSLLVMTSLLEREGMAGKVQTIYFDPPYGIKYGGNWQMNINDKRMPESDNDDSLSGEPEMIKAFRDTWELGIHSYLSYIRDRLLVAKELLSESGSCFVQISDENLHLVRNLLDEVFGSESFIITFPIKKKGSQKSSILDPVNDYLIWYSKSSRSSNLVKYNQLYEKRDLKSEVVENGFSLVEIDGIDYRINDIKKPTGMEFDYLRNPDILIADYPNAKIFKADQLQSGGVRKNQSLPFTYNGKTFTPKAGNCWKTTVQTDSTDKVPGMFRLANLKRFYASNNALYYRRYINDFDYKELNNWWDNLGGVSDAKYVVQTNEEIIKRCILMTSDPGDLVLDPTCGSGTTAFTAEKYGRRWVTIDTSRIALTIAKTRMLTGVFPYFELYDHVNKDVRLGFNYKVGKRITLGSLANSEPAEEISLYDSPKEDSKKLRVSGPFTVETLQNFEPVLLDSLDKDSDKDESTGQFEIRIFEHMKNAGVKNGIKNENAVFKRVERKSSAYLHAEGFYDDAGGKERKAYLHIGPKFGTVSKQAVNEAVKECRGAGDGDWLIILGFSFEADINNQNVTTSAGSFEVTKVRMHDDLMQEGLLKKDKKAASFVTIGEPDIKSIKEGNNIVIEIQGLDIYDPIKDEVKARSVADIAYWVVDDDYDSSNFIVKQVFFCGGDKDEFDKWKKGLSNLSKDGTKAKVQNTLRIEIDDEAFDRLYGFKSHPIEYKKGKKIAVRVISQFGEESMKVITL